MLAVAPRGFLTVRASLGCLATKPCRQQFHEFACRQAGLFRITKPRSNEPNKSHFCSRSEGFVRHKNTNRKAPLPEKVRGSFGVCLVGLLMD
jgi:hypothetical protein